MSGQITIIDRQFESGNQLISFLSDKKEITLLNEAEDNFKKNLLLSVASFHEKVIIDLLLDFARVRSNNNEMIADFIKNKALLRQYHSLFDWDSNNANKFFAFFGSQFKSRVGEMIKSDNNLEDSIRAFLEIGRERNKLVHQNFAEQVIDKTAKEIHDVYTRSLHFIAVLKSLLLD